MAADELEAWELSAMRDPRNWVRPAAAVVAGSAAGARWCSCGPAGGRRAEGTLACEGLRDAAGEASEGFERETRKLLGDKRAGRPG